MTPARLNNICYFTTHELLCHILQNDITKKKHKKECILELLNRINNKELSVEHVSEALVLMELAQ